MGKRPLSTPRLSRSFDRGKATEEGRTMNPQLISIVADERTNDLRRDAERARLARSAARRRRASEPVPRTTIRGAVTGDAEALRRLAQLDSSQTPSGQVLVAEVDGELRAALAVDDGSVIADPFHSTAELVALLRAHAAHMREAHPRVRVVGRSRWSASTPAGRARA
jgi:hypothetical protein